MFSPYASGGGRLISDYIRGSSEKPVPLGLTWSILSNVFEAPCRCRNSPPFPVSIRCGPRSGGLALPRRLPVPGKQVRHLRAGQFRQPGDNIGKSVLRIPVTHLLTLQEGVSEAQFREMTQANVQLVVPEPLIAKFPSSIRADIQTLESFPGDLRLLTPALTWKVATIKTAMMTDRARFGAPGAIRSAQRGLFRAQTGLGCAKAVPPGGANFALTVCSLG